MEHEYVLGTHDEEIDRLGLQHRVWQSIVLDAWQRAGLRAGDTALDVGCGPGYATLDLAAAVGPSGRVIAVDQSQRFLDHLRRQVGARGLTCVETAQRDLSREDLPAVQPDFAWCRWIFAFVRDPRALASRVAAALGPGGRLVIHEYFNYATWRMLPPSSELEEFVAAVMASWRADGGEPDIGSYLPVWLEEDGLQIESVRPLVFIAAPGDPMWQWPATFVRVGLDRLVALGRLTSERATAIAAAFDAAAQRPGVRILTPTVAEVIAVKPPPRSGTRVTGS
jgi:SAM-dependent methyltransferase